LHDTLVLGLAANERIMAVPAFFRLMNIKSERQPDATVSTSDVSHFDGREMAMVHRMFRREFLLAAGVVRQVAGGDIRRARVVAAHLRLICATLHHHHSGEDRYIWPLLERRAPSQVSEHVLCVVEQHRQVDAAQAEVDAELAIWSCRATADSRERLAAALDQLVAPLIDHMDYEERFVVPVMEMHIDLAEWNRIVQTMTAGLDPSDAPLVMGMNMYEGDSDIIEHTIANMPPEVRVGIRELAVDGYAEHAQRVHGTATPPRSWEIRR
jgi:iron-sulfur cluster repair protein YtfE (RIC family)